MVWTSGDPVLTSCSLVSRPCLYNGMPAHFADSPKTEAVYKMLSTAQAPPAPEAIAKLYRPASVVDKAHIHSRWIHTHTQTHTTHTHTFHFYLLSSLSLCLRWLDSSRSLMQQGIRENDKLWLRFKYYNFHDLEPKVCVNNRTQDFLVHCAW